MVPKNRQSQSFQRYSFYHIFTSDLATSDLVLLACIQVTSKTKKGNLSKSARPVGIYQLKTMFGNKKPSRHRRRCSGGRRRSKLLGLSFRGCVLTVRQAIRRRLGSQSNKGPLFGDSPNHFLGLLGFALWCFVRKQKGKGKVRS